MGVFFCARQGDRALFDDKTWHHITRVLRYHPGEIIFGTDGRGKRWKIRLDKAGGEILGEEMVPPPLFSIFLGCALPKGQRQDVLIEKIVELGVDGFYPLICERSIVVPRGKKDRWDRVSKSACEQSGRCFCPEIFSPMRLKDLLDEWEGEIFFAHPGEEPLALSPPFAWKRVLVLVGPEGGFTDEEVSVLKQRGARGFSLGDNILRVETAGIIAVGLFAIARQRY